VKGTICVELTAGQIAVVRGAVNDRREVVIASFGVRDAEADMIFGPILAALDEALDVAETAKELKRTAEALREKRDFIGDLQEVSQRKAVEMEERLPVVLPAAPKQKYDDETCKELCRRIEAGEKQADACAALSGTRLVHSVP
jgi:hypothetical protein